MWCAIYIEVWFLFSPCFSHGYLPNHLFHLLHISECTAQVGKARRSAGCVLATATAWKGGQQRNNPKKFGYCLFEFGFIKKWFNFWNVPLVYTNISKGLVWTSPGGWPFSRHGHIPASTPLCCETVIEHPSAPLPSPESFHRASHRLNP